MNATFDHLLLEACRVCQGTQLDLVLPLLPTPLGNAYVSMDHASNLQPLYPLDLCQCGACGHVQLRHWKNPHHLFQTSKTRMEDGHDLRADKLVGDLGIPRHGFVLEIGGHDARLQAEFEQAGIAYHNFYAESEGASAGFYLETVNSHFEQHAAALAQRVEPASLIVLNDLLPRLFSPRTFFSSLPQLLAPGGAIVLDADFLPDLIEKNALDRISHEYGDYYSLPPLERLLQSFDLQIFDALVSETGRLICFIQRAGGFRPVSDRARFLLSQKPPLRDGESRKAWQRRIEASREAMQALLQEEGTALVAGYGARAGTTTVLYQLGLTGRLAFLVDDNPEQWNLFSPGVQIPVFAPEALFDWRKPDRVLNLSSRSESPFLSWTTPERQAQGAGAPPKLTVPPLQPYRLSDLPEYSPPYIRWKHPQFRSPLLLPLRRLFPSRLKVRHDFTQSWHRQGYIPVYQGACQGKRHPIEAIRIVAQGRVVFENATANAEGWIPFTFWPQNLEAGYSFVIETLQEGRWMPAFSRVLQSRKLPAAIAVRRLLGLCLDVIRPLVNISFRFFLVQERIGHLSANPSVYLAERAIGLHGKRKVDVWLVEKDSPVGNAHLLKMWGRAIPVLILSNPLYGRLASLVQSTRALRAKERIHGHRDIFLAQERVQCPLSFTRSEERRGLEALERMGVPPGAPFVCFHGRDGAYLQKIYTDGKVDLSRYAYRDVSIESYLPAVEALTARGIHCLRMGATSDMPLETTNPRIVDYAHRWRDEFLDVYLGAKCRFFLGCTSGLYAVPATFRRPVVFTNFTPIEHIHAWSMNEITIFKKVFSPRLGRHLTVREQLGSGMGRWIYGQSLARLDLEPVANTAEEIAQVTLEMDDRLNGTWQESEEDRERQRRFWAAFSPSELNRVFSTRIGTAFLRDNPWLLE